MFEKILQAENSGYVISLLEKINAYIATLKLLNTQ